MQFLKLRKPLTALLLLAAIGTASAQNPGFDPPEDFKDDIPERETKEGHIVYLKTFYEGCVVKDSQNKDSINPNCSKFKQAKSVIIESKYAIEDIRWVKYFTSLEKLDIQYNYVKILPDTFPATLKNLNLSGNKISTEVSEDFGHLPSKLETLELGYQRSGNFKALPALPDNLKILSASSNQLTSLPDSLPSKLERLLLTFNNISSLNQGFAKANNLKYVILQNNKITSLSHLPAKIQSLDLSDNLLSSHSTTEFPESLTYLNVERNSLVSLPAFNNSLKEVRASNNQLTSLPNLPDSLVSLSISFNKVTNLPALPSKLGTLIAENNLIASLTELPQSLKILQLSTNQLTALPTLPDSLQVLTASFNSISGELGVLPKNLSRLEISNTNVSGFTGAAKMETLDFSKTKVSSFPYTTIPATLKRLYCQNNNLPSIPKLPEGLGSIKATGNQFYCLPNLPVNLYETDMKSVCNRNCWIGNGGDWKDNVNWSFGHAPTQNDSVIVINDIVTISFQDAEAKYIDARNCRIIGNNFTLNVYGDIKSISSPYFNTTVKLVGNTNQNVYGNPTIKKLIINNSAGVFLDYPLIEDLSVDNGFVTFYGILNISRIGRSLSTTPNPIRGSIYYKQKINKGWSFLGSPLQGQTLAYLNVTIPLGFGEKSQSIYEYDGTKTVLNGWVKSSGLTEAYATGKGFRVYSQTTTDLKLDGTPFVGSKNMNVTFDPSGYNGGGWNLIANPYFSEIDWRLVTNKANMNEAIYIWNPNAGSYSSYVNNEQTNGGSPLVQMGQAFFVKASGPSPKLIIEETSKPISPTYAPFFRTSATSAKLRIVLNDNVEKLTDELIFSEVEGATNKFDTQFDAYKLPGTFINISTKSSDGEDLSINSLQELTGSYPLQVSAARTGKFSFSFKNVETLEGTSAYLIDKLLGKEVEITNETEYEFTTNITEIADRFRVSFSSVVTGNSSSLTESAPLVYPIPAKDQVTLTFGRAKNADVVLINPMGSEIAEWTNVQEGSLQIPLSAENGIYILKVKSNEEIFVYKIVKF